MKHLSIYMLMLLINSTLAAATRPARHIVFELDDVLFEVREFETFKGVPGISALGERVASQYTARYLELLEKDHTYDADEIIGKTRVLFRNKPVPALWQAFFLNKIDGDKALRKAQKIIEKNISFLSPNRYIYTLAAQAGFDSDKEIAYMYPIERVHRLIARLTSNGDSVYIFSNKNAGTMKKLIQKHKNLFKSFKGNIFISGATKQLKPTLASYKQLFNYFEEQGIAKKDIYFIEAQEEYRAVAERNFGVSALLWSHENADAVENILLN